MTILATLLCVFPGPQEPDAPQMAIEMLSLRPLVTAQVIPAQPPFGTLLGSAGNDFFQDFDPLGDYEERQQQFDPDSVVGLMNMLHETAVDDGLLEMHPNGNRLVVRASPDLLDMVARELRAVKAVVGRPIELQVALFRADDRDVAKGILSPEDHAALRSSHELLWSATRTTRSSVRVTFDALRWVRYIRDFGTEVAQGAAIAAPIIDSFAEGIRMSVEPHMLVGSEDIVVTTAFAIGDRRKMESLMTGLDKHPAIDLPELESTWGCTGARLQSGGALAVHIAGHQETGGRYILTVSPRYPTPRPDEQIGGLSVLPVSALSHPALLARLELRAQRPLLNDNQEMLSVDDDGDGNSGYFDADELHQILYMSTQQAMDDGELDVTLSGGFLFAKGTGSSDRIPTILAALQDRILQNVTLECRVHGEPVRSPAPFAERVEGSADAPLHSITLPGLCGRTTTLFRGIEHNVVRAMLPEIAQESSILDVFIENRRSGVTMTFSPTRSQDGTRCAVDMLFEQQSPISRRPDLAAGAIMLTDTNSIHVAIDEFLTEKPRAMGQGSPVHVDGQWWRPTVTMSAR